MKIIINKFITMCFQTASLLDYRKEVIEKKTIQFFRILVLTLGVALLNVFQYVILGIKFESQELTFFIYLVYVIIVFKLIIKYGEKYCQNKIVELKLFDIEFTFWNKFFLRFIGVILLLSSPGLLLWVLIYCSRY